MGRGGGGGEPVRPLDSYHRTETLPGRCHLPQRLQKGFFFFSKAAAFTSTGKRWRTETGRRTDTRDFFPLASVSLFKPGFSISHSGAREHQTRKQDRGGSFCGEGEEAIDFPPSPRFAINLVEKRPAADAQTADDVICNHGPLVSGGESLLLSTRGGAAAAGPSIQPPD